jgi:hypothetical protein
MSGATPSRKSRTTGSPMMTALKSGTVMKEKTVSERAM